MPRKGEFTTTTRVFNHLKRYKIGRTISQMSKSIASLTAGQIANALYEHPSLFVSESYGKHKRWLTRGKKDAAHSSKEAGARLGHTRGVSPG